ncbi:MFS general substrate transporter [Crucibulum laeve]|uniref:MFS general substrate transporter n=1 Tax=Crucibulum laeve TaxID=68775 RepID=A0A5C3LK03_9AGAR|nr:MFS general substrate transporter [Crucibulum laeve]
MASLTPRASGFWAERMASSYFEDDDDLEQQERLVDEDDPEDERTPLDRTIDRIGMGSYQWTLLSLCGFGWMADNMWIQAVAIILPRVQQHYAVPDSYIGTVSSSMFAGMMIGAIGWGTCSDLMGRSTAFNATLFFTALFGILASFANSFLTLCIALFFLGSAVGGSMPTDGTLLLEHMPKKKQYLVTALSVFFSFGSVLAAVVALLLLPRNSCPVSTIPCDMDIQNQGWKYLLSTLGLITLSMFLARIVFFRLHESPRYLVHAGRPQEAVQSLQLISRFNGSALSLELGDVADVHPEPAPTSALDPEPRKSEDTHGTPTSPPRTGILSTESTVARATLVTQYASTGESPPVLESHSFATPAEENPPSAIFGTTTAVDPDADKEPSETLPSTSAASTARPSRVSRPPLTASGPSRRLSAMSKRSSMYDRGVYKHLPRWLRKPLRAWSERVMMVLSPEWIRTTLLVWAAWCAMSLAYTMFNVFLPKLLETSSAKDTPSTPKSLEESLWDVVIFTIGGCPGAILGAYLIESPLGRRWSLAGSTFITAFFCVVFILVESSWAVRASTVGISLSATAMWAVLYGWTPEIFGTKVRGTACGIASALSRIGGMIAPMLGGILLMMNRAIPVYTSVVIFAIAGFCVLLLKEGAGDSAGRKGARVFTH